MTEPRHYLVVHEEFDPTDPERCMEIEHDPTCPIEVLTCNGGTWTVNSCNVGGLIDDAGIDTWFVHRDHPAGDRFARHAGATRLDPGRHEIRYWFQVWDIPQAGQEYDRGLELVDPPRVRAGLS